MRRYTALVAVIVAAAALTAPSALADSIIYEKGGNVWLTNPDGSGQRQVTTGGGYSMPTQANDGTIVAVKDNPAGNLLHRMDRNGNLLNLAGDSSGSGPLVPAIAPGGALVAYHFNNTGSITPGLRTALSHATRETSNDEIFNIGGWINPSWIGDDRVLMFDGSPSFTGDTLIYTVGGSGTQPWFEDPELSLSGGEIDASQTRLAATDTAVLRLYRLNAPPPAVAVQSACEFRNPNGAYFRPTWSPDGTQLAWQEADGIYVADVDLGDCSAGGASLVIPGGEAPDWGPFIAGRRLTGSAPRRVALSALLRGMKVRVNCQCTVTVTLLLARRNIGQAKKVVNGPTTMRVKPTRAGRARLRRGGNSLIVRMGGGGRFVDRKVKILR